jgi:hypothetical protein
MSVAIGVQSGEGVTLCTAPWFICGLERNSNRMLTLLPYIRLSLFFYHDEFNSISCVLHWDYISTPLSNDVFLYYSRPLFCAYTGLIASLKITYCVHFTGVDLRF